MYSTRDVTLTESTPLAISIARNTTRVRLPLKAKYCKKNNKTNTNIYCTHTHDKTKLVHVRMCTPHMIILYICTCTCTMHVWLTCALSFTRVHSTIENPD